MLIMCRFQVIVAHIQHTTLRFLVSCCQDHTEVSSVLRRQGGHIEGCELEYPMFDKDDSVLDVSMSVRGM